MEFVLITPARNEERVIGKTIESVLSQTRLPIRWAIVDDGSTDQTAEIVKELIAPHTWIEFIQCPPRAERNFAGKVHAFNAGLERVQSLDYDVIANLDADVLLEPDHFEFLLDRLADDPKLGVAGTAYTQGGADSTKDSFEGEESVAGPLQFFRKECFVQIGGYTAHPAGGIDWVAVTTARMMGWRTRNFPERKFLHQRVMGTAEKNAVGAMFDYGKKDYFMGRSPLWQLFRGAYRMTKPPYILGGVAVVWGYIWAALTMERAVSPELMRFHRREQMSKLRNILRSILRMQPVERFYRPEEPHVATK